MPLKSKQPPLFDAMTQMILPKYKPILKFLVRNQFLMKYIDISRKSEDVPSIPVTAVYIHLRRQIH